MEQSYIVVGAFLLLLFLSLFLTGSLNLRTALLQDDWCRQTYTVLYLQRSTLCAHPIASTLWSTLNYFFKSVCCTCIKTVPHLK